MKLDTTAYDTLCGFEGLSLKPYYATKDEQNRDIVTIGYGNTSYADGSKVKISDKSIDESTAKSMLQHVADSFAAKVELLVNKELTQNQFNALCIFAYNIGLGNFGISTLLKLVNNNPNDANIAKEFLRWNKQSGKVLSGLTSRRIKESIIYYTK